MTPLESLCFCILEFSVQVAMCALASFWEVGLCLRSNNCCLCSTRKRPIERFMHLRCMPTVCERHELGAALPVAWY